jgi:2-dehydro-3-deoxy-D-arabinonate dehydratase
LKLYRTANGVVAEQNNRFFFTERESLDSLLTRDDLEHHLSQAISSWSAAEEGALSELRAPIQSQEVWGAGVTYYRSRTARMAESPQGGSFYDRVYDAERPELFFKTTPHRVVGHNGKVAVRGDAKWSVPEPEVALVVTPNRKIVGFTVANDMSSRDIEGENPLYLPQAKTYDRSCSLGPGVLVSSHDLPAETEIKMEIIRAGKAAYAGETTLAARKRSAESLVSFLFRHCSFPHGVILMTGTGIIPNDEFTLQAADEIRISVAGIGTLINTVG